jgi:tetratricopeptide (TPR) repeat protein
VALGDRDYEARNPAGAIKHYDAALAADPRNYAALWKASRSAVDLGEAESDKGRRTSLYKSAEQYARRAVEANPQDAEGHFNLARSLGRAALSMGTRDRIRYATDVRSQAMEALKINPQHPGALHVMGMWNAEVMRLNGISRAIARNFLGGQVFGSASWKNATDYMEKAVAVEPNRMVHHLDLAGVYSDVGQKAKAKSEYEAVVKLPVAEFNDAKYKREAEQALKGL